MALTATSGYKRILLKISGEALMGQLNGGLHPPTVNKIASEIKKVHENECYFKDFIFFVNKYKHKIENIYYHQSGSHLLSYKKNIHVIAQINENYWNNRMILQLNIKDVFI